MNKMRFSFTFVFFHSLLSLVVAAQAVSAQDKAPEWKRAGEDISIPVPPRAHPRVFLSSKDIADLKRRIAHPALKPVWDELQQLARTNVQIKIEVDAARFLMTGDRKLGKETIALALKTLQNAEYDLTKQDITRPIGRMMVTGAIAYDWCYGLLTESQKEDFQIQFLRFANQLECGYPPRNMGWVTGHGSEWMVMRDMLSAGLAIYDENPEMYEHAAATFFSYLLPARNFWYPGHAFHQGTAYAETRFSSELYPLFIFDRIGAGNVYHPSQQFVPYYWLYMRRPDGQLMRAGDGEGRIPKLRSLLTASYYKDGYVLSDYLKEPGIDDMHKIFQLLWSDPDLEPQPISDLPLTRYMGFPYGWMVARTGWDESSVIAEMKVNVYNFNNHQHADAGAFQIYHKGPLTMPSGIYQGALGGYGSPHNKNYYWRSIAHNTLLVYDPLEQFSIKDDYVNDGGQRLPNNRREARNIDILLDPANGYRTGEVLAQGFGPNLKLPEYSYLKGDITEAYNPEKVKEVKRTFTFLNLKDEKVPAVLIVFDKVVSVNREHKKFWLLHSMEQPQIKDKMTTIALSERGWSGKLVNTTLLPEADNTKIVSIGGPGQEYWVFGNNFEQRPRSGRELQHESGAWRVEVSPKKSSNEDYFLNVIQVMDKGNGAVMDVNRIDADDVVGVCVSDRIVFYSKSSNLLDRRITFTVTRDGASKILVTDLSPGTWQIRKDGHVLMPAIPVRSDEGTLYFEGGKGEYSLLR